MLDGYISYESNRDSKFNVSCFKFKIVDNSRHYFNKPEVVIDVLTLIRPRSTYCAQTLKKETVRPSSTCTRTAHLNSIIDFMLAAYY